MTPRVMETCEVVEGHSERGGLLRAAGAHPLQGGHYRELEWGTWSWSPGVLGMAT